MIQNVDDTHRRNYKTLTARKRRLLKNVDCYKTSNNKFLRFFQSQFLNQKSAEIVFKICSKNTFNSNYDQGSPSQPQRSAEKLS